MLAVQMACRIGPGDAIVVQAAAGATGGAVVQLAAAAGAEVIAFASSAAKPERAAAVDAVLRQVTAGQLGPRIAARFPLRRASEAHVLLASRAVTGKVLLHA